MPPEQYHTKEHITGTKGSCIRQPTDSLLGAYGVGALRDVTLPMRDMTLAAQALIGEVEQAGLTNINDLSQVPAITLPDDYFPPVKPDGRTSTRTVLQRMSPQGRDVALHLAQIWRDFRGYDSDRAACDAYDEPALSPGAQTFAELTNRFSHLTDQLPPADRETLRELYRHSTQQGPEAILQLLPNDPKEDPSQ